MVIPNTDYPDFTSPPRRLAVRDALATSVGVAATSETTEVLDANDVDDVVLVVATLQTSGSVLVSGDLIDVGADPYAREVMSLAGNSVVMVPCEHRGDGVTITLRNVAGATNTFDVHVLSYAGVPVDVMLPSQTSAYHRCSAVAVNERIQYPQAGNYERATVSTVFDQDTALNVRRHITVVGGAVTLATVTEKVADCIAGEPTVVDVPIGAPGFEVFVENATVDAFTGDVIARFYRPQGQ